MIYKHAWFLRKLYRKGALFNYYIATTTTTLNTGRPPLIKVTQTLSHPQILPRSFARTFQNNLEYYIPLER